MTLSSKQLTSILVLLVLGVGAMALVNAGAAPGGTLLIVLALAAVGAIAYNGGGGATGASVEGLSDAVRRAIAGERPSPPPGATGEVARAFDELSALADKRKKETADVAQRHADLEASERTLEEATRKLNDGVALQIAAADETTKLIKDMTNAIRE